jgi:FkbM family methyltransferase
MLERIEEHSFVAELLRPGARVLDVGCRGFGMAEELIRRRCVVYAMDPDPDIADPTASMPGLSFIRKALVARKYSGSRTYYMYDNGVGNFIQFDGSRSLRPPRGARSVQVECVDIGSLSAALGVEQWDAVKLDCEGGEYDILLDWPGPIAKQLCVEFHEHTGINHEGLRYYDGMLRHLGQWYDVAKHALGRQHGLGNNYWDSVFVLR